MNNDKYACIVTQAKKEIDLLIKHSNELYKRQAAIVSASLTNYFPSVSSHDHTALFEKILFMQRISFLEQFQASILNGVTLSGITSSDLFQLKTKPAILCTFHYGSYRLINMVLATHAIPFALVVSSSVLAKQREGVQKLYTTYAANNAQTTFKIIDAESPTSALQMLRAIKQGYSLVVYIDGNTGAGDPTFSSSNCLTIPFLAKAIKARKGVATLSHIANVPILPLVSVWKHAGKSVLYFGVRIEPAHCKDRENYVQRATTTLFSFIATYLHQDPGQWESLLYLHKFAVAEPVLPFSLRKVDCNPNEFFRFNSRDFGLFMLENNYILLMKKNYMSFMIPPALYAFLQQSDQQIVTATELNPAQFNDLMMAGVLINT